MGVWWTKRPWWIDWAFSVGVGLVTICAAALTTTMLNTGLVVGAALIAVGIIGTIVYLIRSRIATAPERSVSPASMPKADNSWLADRLKDVPPTAVVIFDSRDADIKVSAPHGMNAVYADNVAGMKVAAKVRDPNVVMTRFPAAPPGTRDLPNSALREQAVKMSASMRGRSAISEAQFRAEVLPDAKIIASAIFERIGNMHFVNSPHRTKLERGADAIAHGILLGSTTLSDAASFLDEIASRLPS